MYTKTQHKAKLLILTVFLTVGAVQAWGNSNFEDGQTDPKNSYTKAHSQNFNDCMQYFAGIYPATAQLGKTYPLCFVGFATLYSGDSKTAIYSAHHLTRRNISAARKLQRVDSFHKESRLPKKIQVDNAQYKGTGFDRGHLMPNGDASSTDMQYDSFSFANIVPQNPTHNRGVWRQIESHTRNIIYNQGEGYIVTGTVFYRTPNWMNGVAIPTHLYKAVYLPKNNIAGVYFSPNDESYSYEVIDVRELQARTGINPFPKHNPTFDAQLFQLDSRLDDTQTQSQSNDDTVNFWVLIIQILLSLWQQLSS